MKNSKRNRNTGKINQFKQMALEKGFLVKSFSDRNYVNFRGTLVRA